MIKEHNKYKEREGGRWKKRGERGREAERQDAERQRGREIKKGEEG
jgi:hypothetical protein